MEQSYEIMECGTKAKSLNPLGKYCPIVPAPSMDIRSLAKRNSMLKARREWQSAESERVTYEIDPIESACYCFDCPFPCDKHAPGKIVQGQIINGKLHII